MSETPKLDIDTVQLNYCRMMQERRVNNPTLAHLFEHRMNRAFDTYLDACRALGDKANLLAIEHLDFSELSPETQQVIEEYED